MIGETQELLLVGRGLVVFGEAESIAGLARNFRRVLMAF